MQRRTFLALSMALGGAVACSDAPESPQRDTPSDSVLMYQRHLDDGRLEMLTVGLETRNASASWATSDAEGKYRNTQTVKVDALPDRDLVELRALFDASKTEAYKTDSKWPEPVGGASRRVGHAIHYLPAHEPQVVLTYFGEPSTAEAKALVDTLRSWYARIKTSGK